MQRICIEKIVLDTLNILEVNGKLKILFNRQQGFKGEYEYVKGMIFENKVFNDKGEFIIGNGEERFLDMYEKRNDFVSSIKSAFIKVFIEEVKFCPYCGKVPLISFEDSSSQKKKDKRTFQLDHFFPKDHYPVLAMNLYNLIPVCSGCNFLKSDDDPGNILDSGELFHPYFGWIKKKDGSIKIGDATFFGDKVNFIEQEKVESHFNYFRLNQIYASSQDTVNDIEFIRDKIEKIKVEKMYVEKIGIRYDPEKRKLFYFKNFYPQTEDKILFYANGKLKQDWINGIKI